MTIPVCAGLPSWWAGGYDCSAVACVCRWGGLRGAVICRRAGVVTGFVDTGPGAGTAGGRGSAARFWRGRIVGDGPCQDRRRVGGSVRPYGVAIAAPGPAGGPGG